MNGSLPNPVLFFANELLSKVQPKSVLDPFGRNGVFLACVLETTRAQGLGLTRESSEFEKAKLLKMASDKMAEARSLAVAGRYSG